MSLWQHPEKVVSNIALLSRGPEQINLERHLGDMPILQNRKAV
jgi:hypothetical protein